MNPAEMISKQMPGGERVGEDSAGRRTTKKKKGTDSTFNFSFQFGQTIWNRLWTVFVGHSVFIIFDFCFVLFLVIHD